MSKENKDRIKSFFVSFVFMIPIAAIVVCTKTEKIDVGFVLFACFWGLYLLYRKNNKP